jgi:hypothetical protein
MSSEKAGGTRFAIRCCQPLAVGDFDVIGHAESVITRIRDG